MPGPTTITGDLRYEVVRQIYEGGMGIVYEAQQIGTRGFVKRVAIKVIRERYAAQPEFIENFIGEAKLVADTSTRTSSRRTTSATPAADASSAWS